MSDLRPRTNRPGRPTAIARHGRLKPHSALRTVWKIVASVLGVALVSTVGIGAVAVGDVIGSVNDGVNLVDQNGHTITPGIAAMKGAFNVLLAGSDSGDGNKAYGERGENLNDVTMLMHVSEDHQHITVVSFPRDMFVPIPACPDGKGGQYSAMSSQKINVTLEYGGLACTVLTVEKLTGLTIPYAGLIQFDGVISMSNAVGGVPVCLAGPIKDPYTGLNLPAGRSVIKGKQALEFLRTRHGVGDGSDLGRISNQQVFLSSLVRTIKQGGVLTNPAKVYSLAKAAASNMQLSTSLASVSTMASMAVALKGADISNVVFVQFPTDSTPGGVLPDAAGGAALLDALKHDDPVKVTGGTGAAGIGAVVETPKPTESASSAPPSTSSSTPSHTPSNTPSRTPTSSSSPKPTDSSPSTPSSTPTKTAVALPSQVHGQSAAEQTCSQPFDF